MHASGFGGWDDVYLSYLPLVRASCCLSLCLSELRTVRCGQCVCLLLRNCCSAAACLRWVIDALIERCAL